MGMLRALFGPSQAEIWQELADRVGGSFSDGGLFQPSEIKLEVNEWCIKLDNLTTKNRVTYTRMRAPFVNADQFRFKLCRQGFFSQVGKMFGMQDVEVGFADFDREFIIKGNSEEKLRALFSNDRIRELITAQPNIRFELRDANGWFGKHQKGVAELYFICDGLMKEFVTLEKLFQLFAETLDQLCRMGSAYENDPSFPELAPPVDDGRGVAMSEAGEDLRKDGGAGGGSGAPVGVPLFKK